MRETHDIARLEALLHLVLVDVRLAVVGGQHHQNIGPCSRILDREQVPAVRTSDVGILVLDVANDHIDAHVLHVERLAASLVAVADDRNTPAVE